MFFVWVSRCIPGFSIVALLLLLVFSFPDTVSLPQWIARVQSAGIPEPSELTLPQKVFIIYTVMVHLNTFGFTVRLSWALAKMTVETKRVLNARGTSRFSHGQKRARSIDSPPPALKCLDQSVIKAINDGPEVVHAIIVPNYAEDIDTLITTLKVLAFHPRAASQYEIYLAMEQKEAGCAAKAAILTSLFEKSFLSIRPTFHPAGLPGEIAGKGSNIAFAANYIIQVHHADLRELCNVVITVMDADTHLLQDYFTEIRRLHHTNINEADRSFYCCPIIFDRNSHQTPVLVRCADLIWGFAGMSTMSGPPISIPTSVYSLPLPLAERVGGWDSDLTAIGEDMHMLLKCYFETAGNVVTQVVHVPASQCNVSVATGVGWRRSMNICYARYRQALRHMWGTLDSGFAVRRTMSYFRFRRRCLFLRPRHFALLHLLWQAHFLPSHLAILTIFATVYELCTSPADLNLHMAWTLRFTGFLRTASFIWMNICLTLYERWYQLCVNSRRRDMTAASLADTGFSPRTWWRPKHLAERVFFPVAGTIFGAIPTVHAVFAHFFTDRLVYRVTKKPAFAASAV